MARPAWEVFFESDSSDFRGDVNRAITVQRNFNRTIGNANRSFNQFNTLQARATNLMRGFLAAAAGGGLLALGRGLVGMVDNLRVLEGQLRAGTEEGQNFFQTQDQIRSLALQTNQSIDILTRGYAQLGLSADRARLSHENIIVILETFSNAARIGGSTADDLAEALRQVGQAASEGKLQWEDLSIVMDRVVGIRATLNRYASSRNTTLRQLTSTGFSFDEFVDALNQDRSRLSQTAGGAADTVANSFDRLLASVRQVVGQLDEMLGITDNLSRSFDSFRKTIESIDISRIATEMYAFFIQVRTVLGPIAKLIGLLLEQRFLLNLIVLTLRAIDAILVVLITRGVFVLISRIATATGGLGLTIRQVLQNLRKVADTGVFEALGNSIRFVAFTLGILIVRLLTFLGFDFWRDVEPPESVRLSLFNLRNELRRLVDELDRAKEAVGGEDSFDRLLREALLLEGKETPAQQQEKRQLRSLDERISKMRTFLLQQDDLRSKFISESAEARELLQIMQLWDNEAKVVAAEIERLEKALENASDSAEEGRINAELGDMQERAEAARKGMEALSKELGSIVSGYVSYNLEALEQRFSELRKAMVADIDAMVASIQGLKNELNSFVLNNSLRDRFEEVRRLLSIPSVGFSYETAQRGVRIIREGREELERAEEVSEREVYRRKNSLDQAVIELELARKRLKLGEGNVQELQKELKAKETLVERSKEELANAEQSRKLRRAELEGYNRQASVLLDILDTEGRIAFEREQIVRLGQQANEANRLQREKEEAERRLRLEEYMNRLLQARANLFQQIRQVVETISGNLLDQLLEKTQSWGDFLRENLRLIARFILQLTLIQPLANKVAGLIYPSGANALNQLTGVALPVFVTPQPPVSPVVPGASGFGGRGSPKPVVLNQNINVNAIDVTGVQRAMRSEGNRIARETIDYLRGGRYVY